MLVLLALLLVCAGGGAFLARSLYRNPGPLPSTRTAVVPKGSIEIVATSLRRDGVIADPLAFRIAAEITRGDGPLHAAELAFPAHASLRVVLHVLRTAPAVQHGLTVPEGWTGAEIARALAASDALTGPVAIPADGAVLPQTYDYERGTTRAALLARMEAAMRLTLGRVWRDRDPSIALPGPQALLVMASMVERETHLASERPMVASVFLNRLRLGMRLQSDPTVAYAVTGGLGPLARPLSRADLAFDNPFNTYVAPALPPAPIASPGLASLLAVAHPAASDALYFVADGSGGHAFAATLPDQNRNVARWRTLH